MHLENFIKYQQLREQYPEFIYDSYDLAIKRDKVSIEFTFILDRKATFNPTMTIPMKDYFLKENLSVDKLKSFAFHIGLIEMLSYWKATCSPKIIIKPHKLDPWQVNWWKKQYYLGLGEFLYRNGIKTDIDDFVDIESYGEPLDTNVDFKVGSSVLVPVGGGKDSVVTLETLKNNVQVIPFAMNPRKAIEDTIINAGFNLNETAIVHRKLDPELLKLNDEGYLNGHTPFSALLAFVTGLTAVIAGSKDIALSNESSANESTVKSTLVNHQYSKSFEFESDFREYFSRYMTDQINYFSFLRPWNELQIVKAFSRLTDHHHSFRSCNVGSKTDTWCGHCPKCLFTFIMLSAFLDQKAVIDIFGKDLFDDPSLKHVLEELSGQTPEKPFECVGTTDEVKQALAMSMRKWYGDLPYLLDYYDNSKPFQQYKNLTPELFLNTLNEQHFLDKKYLDLLPGNN